MATSLGMDGYAELDVSMMDPTDKKPAFAFRGLKQFVKELDSKTLPPFLARLCATNKPPTYSEEERLCIFETAAEFHSRTIVPHIGQIVSAIVRIMASVSRPSQSAGCSKAVCTLSRYCIDPLGREEERSEIMSSLCHPLSDGLISSNKSISSGSALCIAALIQSNNWQFASNELVNDVCLKVSGALEEAHCQTVVHVSLVVALLKHNPLTLEPYGLSLMRSGLQILDHNTKTNNSHMIMSSIQMIHSVMRSLNVKIISSEISNIVQALEHCKDGKFMPSICTAAFQAAEMAKLLRRQRGVRKNVSPLGNCSDGNNRKGSNSPIDHEDIRGSQPPVGQCTGILGTTRAGRRLWSYRSDFSHGASNDELFHTSARDYHDNNLGIIAHSDSADLVKSTRRHSDVFTRIGDPCPTCLTPQATNQACRRQALSTPRKQLQSLTYRQCPDHLLLQKNFQSEERKGHCSSTEQRNQLRKQTTDLLTEDLKFPISSGSSDSARAPPCEEHQCDAAAEHQKVTGMEKRETNRHQSNWLTLFFCAMVFAVLFLALWKQQDPGNELYFVPT